MEILMTMSSLLIYFLTSYTVLLRRLLSGDTWDCLPPSLALRDGWGAILLPQFLNAHSERISYSLAETAGFAGTVNYLIYSGSMHPRIAGNLSTGYIFFDHLYPYSFRCIYHFLSPWHLLSFIISEIFDLLGVIIGGTIAYIISLSVPRSLNKSFTKSLLTGKASKLPMQIDTRKIKKFCSNSIIRNKL
jgi:hypothetical protein